MARTGDCDSRSCVNGVIKGPREEGRARNCVPRAGNNAPAANLEKEFNRPAFVYVHVKTGGNRSYERRYASECKQDLVTFPGPPDEEKAGDK